MHSLRRSHEQYNSKNFSPHLSTSSPVPEDLFNELDKDEDREIVESIEAVMKAASYDSNSPKERKPKHQNTECNPSNITSYRNTTLLVDVPDVPCHSKDFKQQYIDGSR
ncbi:unnamed protein product [Schistosoma margrebowiei]|nr:unnamed protein product [Schistosoma margrebowiei]